MCIAAIVPKGVILDESVLRRCANLNSDGAGFAFVNKKGRVTISRRSSVKTEQECVKFMREYRAAAAGPGRNSTMLVHFRFATAGVLSEGNSHPFEVAGGAMVHNGSLFYGGKDAKLSDTSEFVERYGSRLTRSFVEHSKKQIENAIGADNKLAFLWEDGSHTVLQESGWQRSSDAVLFSNGMWRGGTQ